MDDDEFLRKLRRLNDEHGSELTAFMTFLSWCEALRSFSGTWESEATHHRTTDTVLVLCAVRSEWGMWPYFQLAGRVD